MSAASAYIWCTLDLVDMFDNIFSRGEWQMIELVAIYIPVLAIIKRVM